MTVASEVNRTDNLPGDASNRVFSFSPLKITTENELEAYLVDNAGAETHLVKGTSTTTYSVTVASFPGTGCITYPAASNGTAVAADEFIVIKTKIPQTQPTVLENRGGYSPKVHENVYDRLVGMIKELQEEIDRTPRLLLNDANNLGSAAIPLARTASLYLRWNALKTEIDAVAITTAAAAASDANPAALGSVAAGSSGDFARTDHVHPTTGIPTLAGENTFAETQIWTKGSDEASAAQLTFGAGNWFDVTGTTTITSIATHGVGTLLLLHFDAALTFTHHATNLICPGGEDIITQAGTEILLYEYAAADFRVVAVNNQVADYKHQSADLGQKVTFQDDFIGTIKTAISSTAGGGTANAAAAIAAGDGGRVTLKSASDDGNNAANSSVITLDTLDWSADQGGLKMEVRLAIDDVSEAALFVGFTDAISSTVNLPIFKALSSDNIDSDATDACGVAYDIDGTTDEFFQGGVDSDTDTSATHSGSAPSDNTFVTIRVEVSAAGAVEGFINGVSIGTAVASAITPTVAITPCIVISNRSANQVIATIDYIWAQANRG